MIDKIIFETIYPHPYIFMREKTIKNLYEILQKYDSFQNSKPSKLEENDFQILADYFEPDCNEKVEFFVRIDKKCLATTSNCYTHSNQFRVMEKTTRNL